MSSILSPGTILIVMKMAPFHRRLLSILYDLLIVLALLIIGTQFFILATGAEARGGFFQFYLLSLIFCYFVLCWTRLGQTPGMAAWGLRLLTRSGKRLALTRGTIRFFLGLGGILTWVWMFWDKEKLPLYDRLCGTTLIWNKKQGS